MPPTTSTNKRATTCRKWKMRLEIALKNRLKPVTCVNWP